MVRELQLALGEVCVGGGSDGVLSSGGIEYDHMQALASTCDQVRHALLHECVIRVKCPPSVGVFDHKFVDYSPRLVIAGIVHQLLNVLWQFMFVKLAIASFTPVFVL